MPLNTNSRHVPSACLGIALVLCMALPLLAVPTLINYQGRLIGSDGLPVADGAHEVIFALYADSTSAGPLWAEVATITTSAGLFSYLMGSDTPIPSSVWSGTDAVFLQLFIEGVPQNPRSRIAAVPYAALAGGLEAVGDSGVPVIQTGSELGGELYLHRVTGDAGIALRGGLSGDTAVILPDSSISSSETLDEAGFSLSINTHSVELVTMEMTDLVTVNVEAPADGYIILDGKCYVVLEGTTGPNVALVQIDHEQGGSSQFPYYTLAGLNGYVDAGQNFFPVHVTRVYYVDAGEYTFRMEGRASYPPPAVATTWDHVLRAMFVPTDYGFIGKVTSDPGNYPGARRLDAVDPQNPDAGEVFYEVDLRLEKADSQRGDRY